MKVLFKFTRAKGQDSSNSDGRVGEREGTRDGITGTAGATARQGQSAELNKGQATLVGAGGKETVLEAGSRGPHPGGRKGKDSKGARDKGKGLLFERINKQPRVERLRNKHRRMPIWGI